MGEDHISETIHRMTRRLADWDYRQRAVYSITITLADRSREWLGKLAKNGEPQDKLAKNGEPQDKLANNGEPQGGECPVAGHSCQAWADGFQDTVLLHENQLQQMIRYVRDNPRRLAEKRANPDLFRRIADFALPLDNGRITGHFSAIGNRHLLGRPLVQVQCSRRFLAYRRIPKTGGGLKIARDASGAPSIETATQEYSEIRDAVFAAASHGAVVISPCISDGERQIARETFERGFPLVVLRNKGFAPFQKPEGRYFDACADGRLLMLAPVAWPHVAQEKPMTRNDATALNRIAQWICSAAGHSCPASITYRGIAPADIDRLADEALKKQGGS